MCCPDAQMNRAAADRAMQLLDSLNSSESRLLFIQGHGHLGFAHASESDVLLYAVIVPTLVGCISHGEGRRELAVIKAALLRSARLLPWQSCRHLRLALH